MHRLLVLVLSLTLFWTGSSVAHSQLIVNGTTLFDSSGASTGNTAHAVVGGDVSVANAFPVSVTVRVYNEREELIAEVGLLAGDRYHGPHGLSAGSYSIQISSPDANGGFNFQVTATISAPAPPPDRVRPPQYLREPLAMPSAALA